MPSKRRERANKPLRRLAARLWFGVNVKRLGWGGKRRPGPLADIRNTMWEEQYFRMLRSVQRVKKYYDGLIGLDHYDGSQAFLEFRDFVIHVFQDIFHLRDWLKNDSSVTVVNADIDALFSRNPGASPNLHIARDIANGSKHLVITSPSQSQNTKIAPTGPSLFLSVMKEQGKIQL
jgi:hypothetical protein